MAGEHYLLENTSSCKLREGLINSAIRSCGVQDVLREEKMAYSVSDMLQGGEVLGCLPRKLCIDRALEKVPSW